MRFLKTKIALVQNKKSQTQSQSQNLEAINQEGQNSPTLSTQNSQVSHLSPQPRERKRAQNQGSGSESVRATKNIVKNYGKAICSFSASRLSRLYLDEFAQREGVQVEGFLEYVYTIKNKIDGLYHFRSLLLADPNDSEEILSYKKIFQQISEVFIKYFSVNWIFNSRVLHKEAHLKFRFRMLRRIKSPELFTYLRTSSNSKKTKSEEKNLLSFAGLL